MTRQTCVLLLTLPCLLGCKGDGAPGAFEKFLSARVGVLEDICADASDGKRYWLQG